MAEWPKDIEPKSQEEWLEIATHKDFAVVKTCMDTLKSLGYSMRELCDMKLSGPQKAELIYKHQCEALGENAAPAKSTKTASKPAASKPATTGSKGNSKMAPSKGGLLGKINKKKGASKPAAAKPATAPATKPAAAAPSGGGGGVSEEQFNALVGIMTDFGKALTKVTEKMDVLEEKLDSIDETVTSADAFAKESQFGILCMLMNDESLTANFQNEEYQEQLGVLQLLGGEEEEGEEGEE